VGQQWVESTSSSLASAVVPATLTGWTRSSDWSGWTSSRLGSCSANDRLRHSRTFRRQHPMSATSLDPSLKLASLGLLLAGTTSSRRYQEADARSRAGPKDCSLRSPLAQGQPDRSLDHG
jgi:hypothetical protein